MKKLSTFLSLLISIVYTSSIKAQGWTRILGGPGEESAMSMQSTPGTGGFILAGWTTGYGAGGSDVYLVKTDNVAAITWTKTYGGSGADSANSIYLTSDGGYIIAGSTDSYGNGGTDMYVIKTDAAGNLQWESTYGGSGNDCATYIQQTDDDADGQKMMAM